jgi:lipoprotein-anchoring transpeptidase ErfK/SrfK
LISLTTAGTCAAQGWPSWADDAFSNTSPGFGRGWRDGPPRAERAKRSKPSNEIRSGGARPHVAPMAPRVVAFQHDFPAKSIVIDTNRRALYYVLGDRRAYHYPIGVGREGFSWTGAETISRKQAWPDWHPPAEMRLRDQSLPAKMTGGVRNPLGATALYLGNTLYRIHGTNDASSIGRAQSSGCFRMLNGNVVHLASIAEVGTRVSVVRSLSAPAKAVRRAKAG